MKKVMKGISRVFCSLLLIFSMFSILNVLAEEVIFQLTKIEVKEKSDGVIVNDVSVSNGEITNDIIFGSKNDYITYNITIKNNTEDDYTIKSISDDNTSTSLKYTYDDLSNVKIAAGDEKTFNMTITYIEESSNLTITDQAVSLSLTYEKADGTTDSSKVLGVSETTNPKTGDSITIYILLGLASITGLIITTVSKKKLNKTLMVIAVISSILLPFGINADSDKFQITFATNTIQKGYSELITGKEFNLKMMNQANNSNDIVFDCTPENNIEWCSAKKNGNDYMDSNITSIKRATSSEYNNKKSELTDNNIISTDNSNVPTYMWYKDGVIYYYSVASKIVLNSNSAYMFSFISSAEDIDVSTFDTSNVTNMEAMFLLDLTLEELDLSNFDTSKVTMMHAMFEYNSSLTSLDISSFNTSNVIHMGEMFSECSSLETLDVSGLDTSKVTNMSSMFYAVKKVSVLDVSKFETSNVTDMTGMFNSCTSLASIDLSSFDTSKVTKMDNMFYSASSLQVIDISNFSFASNPTTIGMFNRCPATVIYPS